MEGWDGLGFLIPFVPFYNVAKYKRQRNTIEIKYHAANEKYIELLENDRSMLNENIALKETVKQLKQESLYN